MACNVTRSIGRPLFTEGFVAKRVSFAGKHETIQLGQFRCAFESDDDVMFTGVIKYFHATLLFGSIRPDSLDDELDDIFCDASAFKKVGSFMSVRRGVKVEYRQGINQT